MMPAPEIRLLQFDFLFLSLNVTLPLPSPSFLPAPFSSPLQATPELSVGIGDTHQSNPYLTFFFFPPPKLEF